tara:strand:- start:334 stop:723 length:390 start_codon:yes stop_codon:yes gene_type:complete
MRGEVSWQGEKKLVGTTSSGHNISMDWNSGPTPMELTLQMAGACSMVDVVAGLKDRKIISARVELEAERAEESPRVFTHIKMKYIIEGENLPEKLIRRIIDASQDRYCSVSIMLSSTAKIEWELELSNV